MRIKKIKSRYGTMFQCKGCFDYFNTKQEAKDIKTHSFCDFVKGDK